MVHLANYFNGELRNIRKSLVIHYNIPKLCLATYFSEKNILVPLNSIASIPKTPTSKTIVISVKKSTTR